ncbi:MAG: polysaccharide deacetylase family protein [Clostridia bacterium]|nr:polysaccharide deacetylase family protein [Clostridia bacterium]
MTKGFFALFLCLLLPFSALSESITARHGDRASPQIAITIDDCYDRNQILAAIELCEKHQIPVTFFPVGSALKFADGPLWQRALDAGCEIGNHTWSHKQLTELSPSSIRYQLLRTQQKVDEMLGYHYPMQVLRPPYGATNGKVAQAAKGAGYLKVALWDVSQTNAAKALKDVQKGSLLLYHARAKDIKCLKTLIPQLLEKGYECVTVSELLGLEPVSLSQEIYRYEK